MDPEHQTNAINFVEEQFKGAILKESYPGLCYINIYLTFTNQRPACIIEHLNTIRYMYSKTSI